MTDTTPTQPLPTQKLAFGLVLIAVGGLAFVDAVDLFDWDPRSLWRLWPLLLIALGAASEFDALRARRSDGGSFLIGVGVWMLIATQGYFDLGFRSAFPLAVVIVGLFLVIHAVVDAPAPQKKENANDRH